MARPTQSGGVKSLLDMALAAGSTADWSARNALRVAGAALAAGVRELRVSRCNLDAIAAGVLGDCLRAAPPGLRSVRLWLSAAPPAAAADVWGCIAAGLVACSALEHLDLAECDLSAGGAGALAQCFAVAAAAAAHAPLGLRSLGLTHAALGGVAGARAVAEGFLAAAPGGVGGVGGVGGAAATAGGCASDSVAAQIRLERICLARADVGGAEGWACLLRAAAAAPALTALDISGACEAELAPELAAALAPGRIRELRVNGRPLQGGGWLATVARALEAPVGGSLALLSLAYASLDAGGLSSLAPSLAAATALRDLILAGNAIGSRGAVALATVLEGHPSLASLDLVSCTVGAAGATALANALRTNTALTELNLSNCPVADAGATALADALHVNTRLAALHCQVCRIGVEGVRAFATALAVAAAAEPATPALRALDLYGNDCRGAAGAALGPAWAHVLRRNTRLTSLNLYATGLGDACAVTLCAVLARDNATLRVLDMGGLSDPVKRDVDAALGSLWRRPVARWLLCTRDGCMARRAATAATRAVDDAAAAAAAAAAVVPDPRVVVWLCERAPLWVFQRVLWLL